MRLIDSDELIMTIDCSADLGGALGETVRSVKAYAIHKVESARTVDAVKVVRCKDCKHWQDQEEGVVESAICVREKPMVMEIGPHGYCSYGERRER